MMGLDASSLMELMQREEPLHPDLAAYVNYDGPLGAFLNHPLVQDIYCNPNRAALLNKTYEAKLAEVAASLRDARWGKYVFLHERPYRVNAFAEIAEGLDDATYWELLADVWIDCENFWQNNRLWRTLWRAPRDKKDRAMDRGGRKAFAALPDDLTVYRGVRDDRNIKGLSWTLDKAKATWFALRFKRPSDEPGIHRVLTARASKSNVHALLLGRNEREVVVDKINIVTCEAVEPHQLSSLTR